MKPTHFFPIVAFIAVTNLFAADDKRAANTVVLDATGIKNLRIETVEVESSNFEETVFALGRIRVLPGNRAVVSSRVAGRVLSVAAKIDTAIQKGAEVAVIESRQPGDPPPSVRLIAPMSGLISAVHIDPGQPVMPENSLVEIIDLDEIHAVAAVPEHLAGQLKIGQKAHIKVIGAAEKTYQATLEHLGAELETESGTLEAAFHIPNPDLALRPGMRAEFSIVLQQRPDVMSIPRSALQGDAANRFVYVEDFDLQNAFVKTAVVVGQMNDRAAEITSGLLPGDKVVTRGAYSLAFAGGGSVSLKEALDAAHGHEHAADGSELTDKPSANPAGETAHAHGAEGGSALVWKIVSGVLFVLLVVSLLIKRRSPSPVGSSLFKPANSSGEAK